MSPEMLRLKSRADLLWWEYQYYLSRYVASRNPVDYIEGNIKLKFFFEAIECILEEMERGDAH